MPKCKKCKEPFKVPENNISMARATYCNQCINKGLKRLAKLSINDYMKLQAKAIGL